MPVFVFFYRFIDSIRTDRQRTIIIITMSIIILVTIMLDNYETISRRRHQKHLGDEYLRLSMHMGNEQKLEEDSCRVFQVLIIQPRKCYRTVH